MIRCTENKNGHCINANGQCQWCHKTRDQLEIERLNDELTRYKQAIETLPRSYQDDITDYMMNSQCQ